MKGKKDHDVSGGELFPEHLADLKASGLSEPGGGAMETVETAGVVGDGGNEGSQLEIANQPSSNETAPAADDPFDPKRLRIAPDYTTTTGVKKVLRTVPVRKPHRQEFVCVHPEWRLDTAVLDLKEQHETYLVDPGVREELAADITLKTLYVAINTQDIVFIWPVRLPAEDGRLDEWNRSAHGAAHEAVKGWIKVAANMALGAYDLLLPVSNLGPARWPEITLAELLKLAFKDRYIQSLDHPVVRHLRGE